MHLLIMLVVFLVVCHDMFVFNMIQPMLWIIANWHDRNFAIPMPMHHQRIQSIFGIEKDVN